MVKIVRLREDICLFWQEPLFVFVPNAMSVPLVRASQPRRSKRSWYTPRSSFTRAYEEQILLILVHSTIQDVCLKEDVGYEAIMGIIDRDIEREIHWEDLTPGDALGLEEISWEKRSPGFCRDHHGTHLRQRR